MKLLSATLISCASILFTSNAYSETKTYPGSNCVKKSGGIIKYGEYGEIINTHNSEAAHIICNIPRRPGSLSGWFRAVNNHPARRVRCRIKAAHFLPDRKIGILGGEKFIHPFFLGDPRKVALPSFIAPSEAYTSLACKLPPKTAHGTSKLFSYQISQ